MAEPEPLDPPRGMDALGHGIAALVSVAFAASFGLNHGVGNQLTYLIPALRLLDPELYARDWFATQTTQYHPAFARLGALLLALDRPGWAVALGLTVAVALATLALYALSRSLAGKRAGLAVFLLLVTLLFATRTRGPAGTYVFDLELQPSTLSSAFLFAATLAFVSGRFFVSGALLAVGGLFHLNLLLLASAAFGLAQLLLGRTGMTQRLARQLTLPALSILGFFPMFALALTPTVDAELGRHIYLAIRAPHHFVLGTRLAAFLPLVAWQCLATCAALPQLRAPHAEPLARLSALLAGITAVVWVGALSALGSERAAALFAYRLAPHAEVLLALVSIAAGVRVLENPALGRYYGRAARVALALGLLFLVGAYLVRGEVLPAKVLGYSTLLGAACWLATRAAKGGAARGPLGPELARRAPELFSAAALVLLIGFALGPLGRIPIHSSLLMPAPVATRSLATWMREQSPKQALFLIPPDEDSLRYFGERAIVVDWKGSPAVPSEVVAWYRRLEDVSGRRGLTAPSALADYNRLDAPHLDALRARYGFDYAVVRRGHDASLGAYSHAYENGSFIVLNVATHADEP